MRSSKTDRLDLPRQIRVDAEVGRVLRLRADLNRRTIANEIIHLLELGLKAEEVGLRQIPSEVRPRQATSDPVRFPDLDIRRIK